MTEPTAEMRKAYQSSRTNAGLTVANFAMVLLGLVAIARFGNDRLDTGVVNVWSIWGIAHVSVGQSLQVVTALPDGETPWWRRVPLVVGAVGIGAVAVLLLRARLFPDLDANWPAASLVAIAAASVSGLLRGSLVHKRKATLSLAVVCAENAARSLLLLVVLWGAAPGPSTDGLSDAIVPWAIVAPFLLSLPALLWFNRSAGDASTELGQPHASTGRAALTMVPSLASYALLPMLSALDRLPETVAVDALAFDTAIARGPVQVAVFAAPLALQHMLDSESAHRVALAGLPLLAVVVVGSVLATLLVAPESIIGRLLLIALVGGVSLLGYAAILDSVDGGATASIVGAVFAAAALAFVGSALIGSTVSLAPVAWASAAAVGVLALASRKPGVVT